MPDEREDEIKELIKEDKESQKSWKQKAPLIILAVIVVGGIVAFFVLGGTNAAENAGNNQQAATTETTVAVIADQPSVIMCSTSAECQEGFHCYSGSCTANAVLESFRICTANENCTETCSNCNIGKYMCLLSADEIINGHCTECFSDADCLSGYKCDLYYCKAN